MEIDFSQAVPVEGIAQEYNLIAAQCCECRGRYQVIAQSLLFHAEQPYDLIEVVCRHCGQKRRFLFAIGSFFGQRAL